MLAKSVMERYKKLAGTHYVSDIEYKQKQIDVSTAQQNVEDQRQGLLQLHTAMEAAEDDLNHLIVQGESRKAELDRQLQDQATAGRTGRTGELHSDGASIRYRCGSTCQAGTVCQSL
jgi:multidrug resistance efflux pump